MKPKRSLTTSLGLRQKGVALILSMVILLVLTVLAVASMRMGTLQERMTHNLRESTIALNGAESALSDGEAWINQVVLATGKTPEAQGSCGSPCNTPVSVWREDIPELNASWVTMNGRQLDQPGDLTLVSGPPRYVVEELTFDPARADSSLVIQSGLERSGQQYFRVTANSPGRNTLTQAVLQSIYATRF